jgi:opacity protein-like surface antigen
MRLTMPIALVLVLIGGATPAHADGLLTPFIGMTFGGDTTENRTGFGASLAAMGGGVIGFEIDVSRIPGFFGDEDVAGKNNLTTLTGNLIVGIPLGVVRPYVVGGAGLLRSSFGGPGDVSDETSSDLGVDVGGGIMGFFGEHVGARAELRYFRNVTSGDETVLDFSLGDFDFWRASLGVAFRF